MEDVVHISEEALLVKQSKTSITPKSPIHVGFFILERAKAYMYDLYYNKLKKAYGDEIRLIYSDTDSFLLEFKGHEFMEQAVIGPLSHYMDRSNFPKDHPDFDESRKGELGFLKSETAEKRIAGVIALQPKCYCLKLEGDSTKLAAKEFLDSNRKL